MYDAVKEILCNAFEDNPSVVFAAGHSKKRQKALINYCVGQASCKGKVYQEGKAAALLIFRDRTVPFFQGFIQTLQLVLFSTRFNTLRVLRKEKLVKKVYTEHHIPEDAVQFWYLGTVKKHRGNGDTKKLFKKIESEMAGKCLVFETSVLRNVRLYLLMGFQHYHTAQQMNKEFFFFRKDIPKNIIAEDLRHTTSD